MKTPILELFGVTESLTRTTAVKRESFALKNAVPACPLIHSMVLLFTSVSAGALTSLAAEVKGKEAVKMTKELATVVVNKLLACSGELDKSIIVLENAVDQNVFDLYRREVGKLMGLFYIDILRELFRQFPDLEPESMK